MPLSEDEQRILKEIEANLNETDPRLVQEVSETTLYRHSARAIKWAVFGFVAGLALLLFTFTRVLLLGVVRNALILADVANEVLNFVTGLLLVASVLAPNLGAVWRRRFSHPVHLEGKSPR